MLVRQLVLCEAWILTGDFETKVQSEWSLRKIMLMAGIVDGATGGARCGERGCAGALYHCAACALDQGAG